MRIGQQNSDIKGAIVRNWLDLVCPDSDGNARGERATRRAEDIVRANGWTLSIRSAIWLGQHNGGEIYEGKPTGVQISILSERAPEKAVDRKYIKGGKEVAARELEVCEWKREPGTKREWLDVVTSVAATARRARLSDRHRNQSQGNNG